MTAFHKVQAVSGALIVLCFLTAAPASGQAVTQDEAARAIALLKKGPPPRIPPDEWRTLRLVLIAGLGDEPASSAVAVPFLIETLTDPDPEIVAAAAGSLLKLDPAKSSANAAAALMRVLRDGSGRARQEAARMLRGVPPDRVSAILPALTAALTDSDRQVRLSVIDAIASFDTLAGGAAAQLRSLLNESDPNVASAAAAALVRVEPAPDPALVPLFAAWLESTDESVRARALDSLEMIGSAAVAALPALIRLLGHLDESMRWRAVDVIGSIGPAAAAAAPHLQRLSEGAGRTRTQDAATRALVRIGAVTPPPAWSRVVPEMDVVTALRQFGSADPALRSKGLDAIEAHREGAAAAMPALIAALADKDLPFRYRVAYTMTTVNPDRAHPALPVLREMMRSDVLIPGTSPRVLAPIALGRLGYPGAEALVEALGDAAPQTRQAAALGLMNSEEFPMSAVPALLRTARDPDESVRLQSLSTLISRDAPEDPMVQTLLAALNDTSQDVRAIAAGSLSIYGAAARRAVPALRAIVRDPDPTVAISAQAALAAIDPDGAVDLLPFFVAALSGESPGTFVIGRPGDDMNGPTRRLVAIAGIEALGPRAASALPALRRLWQRDEGLFQLSAGAAIVRVDPKSAPEILAVFIELLQRKDDGPTHYSVLARLKHLGRLAAPAEHAVRPLLGSNDPEIRKLAAETLFAITRR